jgi:hypothetical protein
VVATFSAPTVPLDQVVPALRERGFAVLAPQDVAALCSVPLAALQALEPSWDDLAPDEYLKDGGRYRQRRHACFVVEDDAIAQAPHRAHWQPVEYNALHGGMHRWFEPVTPGVVASPAWHALLRGLGRCFSAVKPVSRWFVEAHQFRIDTAGGLGRPTPEGAHRDGVDFVAVFLVARTGIKGGETRVFEANGPDGQRFTLEAPWSVLLLDDARVIHESTPIQPLVEHGHRDTLVLTYRADGFQGDDVAED